MADGNSETEYEPGDVEDDVDEEEEEEMMEEEIVEEVPEETDEGEEGEKGDEGEVGEEPEIEEETETEATESDISEIQEIVAYRQSIDLASDPRPINRLTKYELAALIGFRAQSIAEGGRPYVSVTPEMDPIMIAERELELGLLPFMI